MRPCLARTPRRETRWGDQAEAQAPSSFWAAMTTSSRFRAPSFIMFVRTVGAELHDGAAQLISFSLLKVGELAGTRTTP